MPGDASGSGNIPRGNPEATSTNPPGEIGRVQTLGKVQAAPLPGAVGGTSY